LPPIDAQVPLQLLAELPLPPGKAPVHQPAQRIAPTPPPGATQVHPRHVTPRQVAAFRPADSDDAVYDNPIIGGRATICVLMYGDYHEMHRACLGAILTTTPANRRQIRVACNAVCPDTREYLRQLREQQLLYKVIDNADNRKKYPAMRQLFYDEADPITDKWIVWFDDDSIANRDGQWYPKLLTAISAFYDSGARLFGAYYSIMLQPSQLTWVKSRPWYRGRPFQDSRGRPSPNANRAVFAAGGFWALETALMRAANIPDPEIGHNGGDYIVGEQVWQAGYTVKDWNSRKQFIHTSSVARRGLVEHHTGTPNWRPGGRAKEGYAGF
jgi:hypothetical protein